MFPPFLSCLLRLSFCLYLFSPLLSRFPVFRSVSFVLLFFFVSFVLFVFFLFSSWFVCSSSSCCSFLFLSLSFSFPALVDSGLAACCRARCTSPVWGCVWGGGSGWGRVGGFLRGPSVRMGLSFPGWVWCRVVDASVVTLAESTLGLISPDCGPCRDGPVGGFPPLPPLVGVWYRWLPLRGLGSVGWARTGGSPVLWLGSSGWSRLRGAGGRAWQPSASPFLVMWSSFMVVVFPGGLVLGVLCLCPVLSCVCVLCCLFLSFVFLSLCP
jgi:hypothetical protein